MTSELFDNTNKPKSITKVTSTTKGRHPVQFEATVKECFGGLYGYASPVRMTVYLISEDEVMGAKQKKRAAKGL